jgi:peptidoglycan biosynthesis protein MviN/MurJ (putative lipid II flippase)
MTVILVIAVVILLLLIADTILEIYYMRKAFSKVMTMIHIFFSALLLRILGDDKTTND